ncbi:hypothetical protein DMJ13_21645 [halophilic archaeon]|nr:hypothetical protein DMJ13_21645 [halophilic archaeon]
MKSPHINPQTAVPDDETPAARCPYCERPFEAEQSCALHLGEVHPNEVTADEEVAYEEATTAEADDLWVYHMKVVVSLAVIYAMIVLIYMIVLG